MLLGNINAIPFRRRFGGGGGTPFPNIPGMIVRWSAKGLTNEDMSKNPVWKDLTGNGHDLQMKNFAWGGMSGVGGYKLNWGDSSIWINHITQGRRGTGEVTDNTIHITSAKTNYALFETRASLKPVEYKVLIKGLTDDIYLRYGVFNDGEELWTEIKNDGIYTLPSYDYDSRYNMKWKVMSQTYPIDCNITIEQLPLYPGALVFDGVDDYGICENFPILTKEKGYTVVALRQWIDNQDNDAYLLSNAINGATLGAFVFERNKNSRTYNFGNATAVSVNRNPITYQTSNRYNSIKITAGTILEGNDVLLVGNNYKTGANLYANVAIWELVFLDHDATEEELTKIKDYFVKTYPWLFPDQAWTVTGKTNEDTDRATIANITGNGNDLVLGNFGFAENSGYGLYAYNFNSFVLKDNLVKPTDVKNDSFRIVGTGNSSNVSVLLNISNSANWKIRITGMKEGDNLIVGNANKSGDYFTITKDGIYTFQKQYEASSTNGIWYNSAQETDVLVEQIPDYEGYLVTDGVDDKIQSSAFTVGKDWTIVGEWEFLKEGAIKIAGIAKFGSFRLYNYSLTGRMNLYINSDLGTNVIGDSIKAATSKGSVYLDFNEVTEVTPGDAVDSGRNLFIGYNGNNFTKLAFKNLAIYPTVLSKEDCIKSYIYLQALKAK